MDYGIQEKENIIKCANCGRVISNTGKYSDNFCYNCGNPLNAEAIDKRELELEKDQQILVSKIEKVLLEADLLTKEQVKILLEDL